jgi:nucleoside-diphosphate-sugar epimerase
LIFKATLLLQHHNLSKKIKKMHTILGINGVTGLEIANCLQEKGIAVRGVSRRPFAGAWEHIQADVMDFESLKNAINGSEVVYFCVGLEYNTKIWQRDWLPMIENVINACISTGSKLVFIDNVYMYGFVKGEMTENTPMNPSSKKGEVRKAVAEKLMDAFKNRGLIGCIARAADFYGPNSDKSVITDTVFKNLQKGKTAQWFGNSDKVHSFTYTKDIGKAAVILGTEVQANGKVWHLPTAKPWTGQQIVNFVAKEMGQKSKIMTLKGFLMTVLGLFIPILKEFKEMMYQYEHDYVFNTDLFEKTFGMKATPMEIGLKTTADFYKSS